MSALEQPIKMDGMIDVNHHLILENEKLPVNGPIKVKVVITPLEDEDSDKIYGLFKDYANPELINKESGAWRAAAVKKHASY